MDRIEPVQKISGVACAKDPTYYTGRGLHKNFNELYQEAKNRREKKQQEEQKKQDSHDKTFETTVNLGIYQNMRNAANLFKKENENHQEEKINVSNLERQKAINEYEHEQEMSSLIFRAKYRISIDQEESKNNNYSEEKKDDKEIEESER